MSPFPVSLNKSMYFTLQGSTRPKLHRAARLSFPLSLITLTPEGSACLYYHFATRKKYVYIIKREDLKKEKVTVSLDCLKTSEDVGGAVLGAWWSWV